MKKPIHISYRHIFTVVILTAAMLVAYFAGTVSVEASWFTQTGTRATANQKAAVSAAVSLLLGEKNTETIFLPLVVK